MKPISLIEEQRKLDAKRRALGIAPDLKAPVAVPASTDAEQKPAPEPQDSAPSPASVAPTPSEPCPQPEQSEQSEDWGIGLDLLPQIPSGIYEAVCISAKKRFAYGELKAYLIFQIITPGPHFQVKLPGYCPLPKKFTQACKIYKWLTIALGRTPTRFDRPSPHPFLHKVFMVKVGLSQSKIPSADGKSKIIAPPDQQYSEITDIISITAGRPQP